MQKRILSFIMSKLLVMIIYSMLVPYSCISQIRKKDKIEIENILKRSVSVDNQFDGSVRIIALFDNQGDIKVIADTSLVNTSYMINELNIFFRKKRYLKKYLPIIARYRLDTISNEEKFSINRDIR